MKNMKQKLMIPLLLIIVITPVATLGIYNVLLTRYFDQTIEKQLLYAVETSQILIKRQLSEIVYESDKERIANSLSDLNQVLGNTITTLNLELVLYGADGTCIFPVTYDNSFLDENLIDEIALNLDRIRSLDAHVIHSGDKKVAIAGYKLTELPISDIPYVVFVSSMDVARPVMLSTNIFLISIMSVGITLGILFTVSISNKIVKPVKELCVGAQQISQRKPIVPTKRSNILEIVQLSDKMVEMSTRLKDYDQAQKAFLQDASHEIKNPLMSIQGYAEGIENGLFPDAREAGAVISKESKRLNRILTELLTLSRIDNQNYFHRYEPADLNEVLQDSVQLLKGLALKASKEIELELDSEQIPIQYNEELFAQCIMNITDNAIRYADKIIRITTSKSPTFASVTVEDDGMGIDDEDLPNIFKRFHKGKGGQFGLGLAIAKKAAKEMGGDITASNTGHGACFTIQIPLNLQKTRHS